MQKCTQINKANSRGRNKPHMESDALSNFVFLNRRKYALHIPASHFLGSDAFSQT